MSIVISLFNHKGGVSKTTTTFHLGWKLADLGFKVLIVDADPQCNLTGMVLGVDDYDKLSKFYIDKDNSNIYDSLSGVFGFNNKVSSVISGVNPAATKNANLSILAGHINFARFDLQLATALTSSAAIPVLKPLIGSMNTLIRQTAKQGNFDITLIDMSPSVSATNMCLFMASDYFIIPTSPDFYCYQAIDSLKDFLPEWADKTKPFRDNGALERSVPKMLGVISQNYRVYSQVAEANESGMTKSFQEWADRIQSGVYEKLEPSLKKAGMIIEKALFEEHVSRDTHYNLANIQNFNTLLPVSQKLSKPMFTLTKDDCPHHSGAVWCRVDGTREVGTKINIQNANYIYTKLAKSVCGLIGLDTVADKGMFDALLKTASKPLT